MKNKVIIIILVIAMFIPTAVAVVHYNGQQGGEVSNKNVVSMTMKDTLGNTYDFTREKGDEAVRMLNFFITLNAASTEIGVLPSTVSKDVYFQAEVNTTVKKTAYKYYFTLNAEDCYFMDGDGRVYQIPEKNATEFICSSYAACLYENGMSPTLTMSGSSVVPDTGEWSFLNKSGKYQKAQVNVKNEVEELRLEGGFAMNFSILPDLFNVKVTDKSNGSVLFDDTYDNIAGLTINENMSVEVLITAKWYEDTTRNYYGEATYIFSASLSAPAQFYAGVNTVEIGEFVCITAVNVNSPENITFTSEPSIEYTPKFFRDGDYSYALIPFKSSLAAGSYALSFSYGGTSQNVNINLAARTNTFKTRDIKYTDAIYAANFSTDAINKATAELTPLISTTSGTRFFDGAFISGPQTSTISVGFGHTVNIVGKNNSFVHSGIDYTSPAGTKVGAINAGEVVFAGYFDYTGYIVVVDHGYGLKSWYTHLSKTSVEKGAMVKTGDTVGECGATGFAAETGVHVGLTVFDVPVCQYTLWEDGANKGIPVYKPE